MTDGSAQRYRCFVATADAVFPTARRSRWNNFDALKAAKTRGSMRDLLLASLPEAKIIRIHVSGDFFSADYFLAWCDVARARADILFYAYTKSISWWIAHRASVPANLKLTASYGGKFDALIKRENLKFTSVVFSPDEAERLALSIDHDDSHAYGSEESFALLLHGQQASGSPAAKALTALRSSGYKGYSRIAKAA